MRKKPTLDSLRQAAEAKLGDVLIVIDKTLGPVVANVAERTDDIIGTISGEPTREKMLATFRVALQSQRMQLEQDLRDAVAAEQTKGEQALQDVVREAQNDRERMNRVLDEYESRFLQQLETERKQGQQNLETAVRDTKAEAATAQEQAVAAEQARGQTALQQAVEAERAQGQQNLEAAVRDTKAEATTAQEQAVTAEQARGQTALQQAVEAERAQGTAALRQVTTSFDILYRAQETQAAEAQAAASNALTSEQARGLAALVHAVESTEAKAADAQAAALQAQQDRFMHVLQDLPATIEAEIENRHKHGRVFHEKLIGAGTQRELANDVVQATIQAAIANLTKTEAPSPQRPVTTTVDAAGITL